MRGLILDEEQTVAIAWQLRDAPVISGQNQGIQGKYSLPVGNSRLVEQGPVLFFRGSDSVDLHHQGRLFGIGCAYPAHFRFIEVPAPAVGQPEGMVEVRFPGFRIRRVVGQACPLPDALPQDAVDEALQPLGQACRLHRVDRFVDCCRIRDTVEQEELEQADFQTVQDKGAEFGQRMAAQAPDQRFQELTLPQYAIDQLHGQGAVFGCKLALADDAVQHRFDRQALLLNPTERFNGGEAGALGISSGRLRKFCHVFFRFEVWGENTGTWRHGLPDDMVKLRFHSYRGMG